MGLQHQNPFRDTAARALGGGAPRRRRSPRDEDEAERIAEYKDPRATCAKSLETWRMRDNERSEHRLAEGGLGANGGGVGAGATLRKASLLAAELLGSGRLGFALGSRARGFKIQASLP